VILDTIENAPRYFALYPGIQQAFEFLQAQDLRNKGLGTYEIDGKKLFVIVSNRQSIGRVGLLAEAHRNYIDIQVTLSGTDCIGWLPLKDCSQKQAHYDAEKDCEFYLDEPQSWCVVPEGSFAIFFPDDVHAPLAGEGEVKKAVVKMHI
jgi:biofilm protein TabA